MKLIFVNKQKQKKNIDETVRIRLLKKEVLEAPK